MSKFLAATVAALVLSVSVNSFASAGEKVEYKRAYCAETKCYCQYKKVVCYKTVTDYRIEKVKYVKCVTEYDHCGKPYEVKKVCYKEVEVPFEKEIAVVKWVKVCD